MHDEDILSMSVYSNKSLPAAVVASASYDGDIYIWSLETGSVLSKLNRIESFSTQTQKQVYGKMAKALAVRVENYTAYWNFDQYFDYYLKFQRWWSLLFYVPKFRFLTKIWIFAEDFDFCPTKRSVAHLRRLCPNQSESSNCNQPMPATRR